MKRIYLVRHGETKMNDANLVQDHADTLSATGYEQVKLVARRFENIDFDTLYSSDYIRATETAKAIAKMTDKEPILSSVFREVKRPSSFVGMSRNSTEYYNFFQQADEQISDPSWHFEDEENFHDVMKRVREAFKIFDESTGDIAVVTHGRFLMFLVVYVLLNRELTGSIWKLSAHTMLTNNTGITVFEYDEQFSHWRLKTFNDIAHFAE